MSLIPIPGRARLRGRPNFAGGTEADVQQRKASGTALRIADDDGDERGRRVRGLRARVRQLEQMLAKAQARLRQLERALARERARFDEVAQSMLGLAEGKRRLDERDANAARLIGEAQREWEACAARERVAKRRVDNLVSRLRGPGRTILGILVGKYPDAVPAGDVKVACNTRTRLRMLNTLMSLGLADSPMRGHWRATKQNAVEHLDRWCSDPESLVIAIGQLRRRS